MSKPPSRPNAPNHDSPERTHVADDSVLHGGTLAPLVLDESAWAEILPDERDVLPVPVVTLAPSEGRYTLSTNDPRNRKALEAEFRKSGQTCGRALARLGLHREFGDVLGSMLNETRLVVVQPIDATDTESSFYIVKGKARNDEPSLSPEEQTQKLERLFLLNPKEVEQSSRELECALKALNLDTPNQGELRAIGLKWVIGRKIMELTNTACYLRQEYGGFRPMFGGYTPMYLTRRTIAINYLTNHMLKPDVFNVPDVETERIIHGFGLHWLASKLLSHDMVRNEQQASWVTQVITKQYRDKLGDNGVTYKGVGAAAALSTDELSERLSFAIPNGKPAFSNEVMQELADAIDEEDSVE